MNEAEVKFKQEPIFMASLALQEMCDPTHTNNIFRNYAFNTVSQYKNIAYLEPPPDASDSIKDRYKALRSQWLNDQQIEHKQTVFEDKCVDPTLKDISPQCPTDKTMLHSAMFADHQNQTQIKELKEKY